MSLILIYDIEDDRLRTRASEICLDYGLERIQFSAFFGKLNRNRRQELALRLQREMGAGRRGCGSCRCARTICGTCGCWNSIVWMRTN